MYAMRQEHNGDSCFFLFKKQKNYYSVIVILFQTFLNRVKLRFSFDLLEDRTTKSKKTKN